MSSQDLGALFRTEELEAVRSAVAEAEQRTAGEIVPVVVGACDDYDEASWKAAAVAALLSSVVAGLVHLAGGFWGGAGFVWITLPCAGGAAAGYLAAQLWPGLRRAMVGDETLQLRAERRAHQAFVDEEVFATRDRTGILVFVANFERRVVVLGDAGINRAVHPSAWEHIVEELVAGIRSGRLADALVQAIGECGQLLEEHGVELQPDDVDELANDIRLEDR